MIKSPINFRASLVIAVSAIFAVFSAYLYAISKAAGIAVGTVYLCIFASALAFLCFRLKGGKVRLRVVVAFALGLTIAVSAFSTGAATVCSWKKSADYAGYRFVEGRVSCVDTRTGDYRVDIGKLSLDGEEVKGTLRVTFSADDRNSAENIMVGDTISFYADVRAKALVSGLRVDGTAYRTGIRYTASVGVADIKITYGKPTVIERLLGGINRLLVDNMGEKYGNIAFSLITGDKHALDTDITDYFSAAGLGHILAVSGLHIGFLMAVIDFLLKRADRRVRFGVMIAAAAVYCVIADFSPSVIRASIMTVIASFSVFVGGRRDILSSLFFAFSLILCFRPIYLFEAGFLLSFGAIFGIAMFSGAIERFLLRRGSGKKLGGAIGTGVSVQIGIAPTEIYFFGRVNLIAFIVNIVVIPYISIVFIVLILFTAIAAIPNFGPILVVCEYMIMPVDYIAYGISRVPYSSLYVNGTVAAFLSYPAMFFASEYFMMPRGKIAVILASAAVIALFCLLSPEKRQEESAPNFLSMRSVTVLPSASLRIDYDEELKALLQAPRCSTRRIS